MNSLLEVSITKYCNLPSFIFSTAASKGFLLVFLNHWKDRRHVSEKKEYICYFYIKLQMVVQSKVQH